MMENLPGSALRFEETDRDNAFARFTTVLDATNGITLSQLQDITGVQGTTIQNWIKRGWVISPVEKRYGEAQLARILLINMVRDILPLESIAEMMSMVNGSVYDRNDDMLPDREWYNLLCKCILAFDESKQRGDDALKGCIEKVLSDIKNITHDDIETLAGVLFIMVNAYQASHIKKVTYKEWDTLLRRKKQ